MHDDARRHRHRQRGHGPAPGSGLGHAPFLRRRLTRILAGETSPLTSRRMRGVVAVAAMILLPVRPFVFATPSLNRSAAVPGSSLPPPQSLLRASSAETSEGLVPGGADRVQDDVLLPVGQRTGSPPVVTSAKSASRLTRAARGSEDGMTGLYLSQGRPEAVCCVYPWDNKLIHEFDSLSRDTFIARRDGGGAWRPAAPGVEFKPVPAADVPAQSPAARLRQMKTLAGQFSSTMHGWRDNNADREILRLLPQPLYRHESRRTDILDGAVFAFVQGTELESLLLLEACQTGDRFEWQFAFARRTSGELEGRHLDRVVWRVPRSPQGKDPLLTHFGMGRAVDPAVLNNPEPK